MVIGLGGHCCKSQPSVIIVIIIICHYVCVIASVARSVRIFLDGAVSRVNNASWSDKNVSSDRLKSAFRKSSGKLFQTSVAAM